MSSIEWTQKTWNPTTGCTKISKECDNCYAETMTNRLMVMQPEKYGKGFDVFVEHPDALDKPLKEKKPTTYFVNSMSDLFHKDATLEFIKRVFKVMNDTPRHTYQVLTKRHHELTKYASELNWTDNIWMGVSVGDNVGKRRIKHLVDSPAKHKFLSIEPIIERLEDLDFTGLDLVYVGGESGNGPNIRPMEPEWVNEIMDKCKEQNITFFFKQWGKTENNPDPNDPTILKAHPFHSKGGCLIDGKLYRDNPCVPENEVKYAKLFGKEYLITSYDEYSELHTIWELESYLPIMEKELFEELKKDIIKNNLIDPILYILDDEGKKIIIEGHTRYRACIETNSLIIASRPINEEFNTIDEVYLWMVKHQNQRRNLSTLEKIKLAYLSKSTIEKLAKENQSKAGKLKSKLGETDAEIQKVDTNLEIAKIAGVGKSTAMMYSQLIDHASKNLLESLDKGEVSIKSAYNTIKDKNSTDIKKPKIKPITIENVVIELESYEDGINKLESGHIDLMVKDKGVLNLLKKNAGIKIGIVNI